MVQPAYVGERPEGNSSLHLHRYEVLIRNTTDRDVQLLARRWRIEDPGEIVQEVHGRGVVGAEPVIEAGKGYSYVSGAAVRAQVGRMHGMYLFLDLERGERFWVAIPAFQLEVPWAWN